MHTQQTAPTEPVNGRGDGPVLVRIVYRFHLPVDEYLRQFSGAAEIISRVPGLHWKIWELDRAAGRAGGTYLFADAACARAYLDGDLIAGLAAHPAISDVRVECHEVLVGPTAATRGPVSGRVATAPGPDVRAGHARP